MSGAALLENILQTGHHKESMIDSVKRTLVRGSNTTAGEEWKFYQRHQRISGPVLKN